MELRRLAMPIVLGLATSAVALVSFVLYVAHEMDQTALQEERETVSILINRQSLLMQVMAVDSGWWNEAYEKVTLEKAEDDQWLIDTFGDLALDSEVYQLTMLMREDGSLIISSQMDSDELANKLLDAGIKSTVLSMQAAALGQPDTRHGALLIDQVLYNFGISTIVPATPGRYAQPFRSGPQPTVAYFSILTQPEIMDLGDEGGISGLQFSSNPDIGSYQLLGPNGTAIGSLLWRVSTPGSDLLDRLALPTIAFILILGTLLFIFIERANRIMAERDRAISAKSDFLASMSHEIRTPLNAIIGFSDLLASEHFGKVEGEKNKEYLTLIKQSSNHLLAIINDILDISKLEAGQFGLTPEPLNAQPVIREGLRLMDGQIADAKLSLKQSLGTGRFMADERVVHQILLNLLSNAVKFTKPGGKITVVGAAERDFYAVTVTDTGKGMSPTEINTALAMFGQVRDSAQIRHEGTGLGLPLVDRFVRMQGGTLDIQSTKDIGTSVTFRLPLVQ